MQPSFIARNDLCPCGSGKKYKKCCSNNGNNAQAALPLQQQFALIQTYCEQGNLLEAGNICKALLAAYPQEADVLYYTAIVMLQTGEAEIAIGLLQRALHINNKKRDYYGLLAASYHRLLRFQEAEIAIQQAITLHPDDPTLYDTLGTIYVHARKLDNALSVFKHMIATWPHYYRAYRQAFFVLYEQGNYQEANALYAQFCLQNPPLEYTLYFLLSVPPMPESQEQIHDIRNTLEQRIDHLMHSSLTIADPTLYIDENIFFFAYHNTNNKPLLTKLSALYLKLFPVLHYVAPHCQKNHAVTSKSKIRLGIVSGSFHNHSVGYCFNVLIDNLLVDARFEIVIINVSLPSPESTAHAMTAMKLGFGYVQLPSHFSAESYALVANQQCDILLYPDIGLNMQSYLLAFGRLAPVQCCLPGHPITTGIPTLDYYIVSDVWEPENAQDYYSETLVRLKTPLIYVDKPAPAPFSFSRSEIRFPEGKTLYACPATLHKMHPDFDQIIARILEQDPDAIVVLFEQKETLKQCIRARFEKHMPAFCDRVFFSSWIPKEHFMCMLNLCDVLLDPLHFGLASTLYNIFAVGTPLVTWPGNFVHGRVATGLYERMGITELIANDWEEYVQIALRLGRDNAFRQQMKEKILANNHVIYGDTGIVKEFADRLANLAPSYIKVSI